MLVDGIGLHFDDVSTVLNGLPSVDTGWWSLGKLFAYRAQEAPFIHIDTDCFIWKSLPSRITMGDVFGQNPEPVPYDDTFYNPGLVQATIEANAGWIPEELAWFLSARRNFAVNTGIFGGNRLDFIQYYADRAIQFTLHPANQRAWGLVYDKTPLTIFTEQYLLSACIDYHHGRAGSAFPELRPRYLFCSMDDALDPTQARRVGFTHLMGLTKLEEEVGRRLQARVACDYPEHAERCVRYLARARQ